MSAPRFTEADALRAYEQWGANCGPGALTAIVGMTLDQVRPHLIGFDAKHYTNPTMMFRALDSIGVQWRAVKPPRNWPDYGLARVQWEGPWTVPGVPPRVAYRHTHWVGAEWSQTRQETGIFDINCMNNGSGWVSVAAWVQVIVPHLTGAIPRANGRWHLTHVLEVAHS